MQLRIFPLATKVTSSGFKHSNSALLSAITVGGIFSTVIFNSTSAKGKVSDAFKTFADLLASTPLYDGAKAIGNTFKDWGTTLVAKKDEFKKWVEDYLNASGLKSGAVELYNKLYDWATIVYEWFRDKFLIFLSRIPEMVQNWKKLRLSLFKWGTFLGGGGGSALWAMFGSGDNWDKLGDLLGNPEFVDVVDKFSTLLENNQSAFEGMTEEEAKEMFEKILEDPAEARKNIEELLEDQEEMNKDSESDTEEKKDKELTKEEILEKLSSGGGGSPKNPEGAFKNMVSDALQELTSINGDSWDQGAEFIAWNAMNKYINTLKKEVKEKPDKSKVKKEFLDALEGKEQMFISSLAKSAKKAFDKLKSSTPIQFEKLVEEFGNVLEKELTVEATGGEEGVSLREHLPTGPRKKKR